jgi:UDP-3-O-[3-hydroxymyristoyl] glucosamine N-acyltransferase
MEYFTTTHIKKILSDLRIPFASNEVELDGLSFKSFRRIETRGIYYAEGKSNAEITESLVLCSTTEGFDRSNCLITVSHPQLAFYKLMRFFYGHEASGSVHPSAIVDPGASISPSAEIGPYCVIGRSEVQAGVRLSSHVVVADNCIIGENTVIESHSTIGASGVAWVWDVETNERIIQPQIGGVVVGKNCFLGSDVSLVRGSVNENTTIGDGTVIAHGTKVGHGCAIGADNHFANNVSLAGNVTTGERCFFGSAAVVRPMITLAADTTVGAGAVVVNNVLDSHLVLMGVPARSTEPAKEKLSGVPKKTSTRTGQK